MLHVAFDRPPVQISTFLENHRLLKLVAGNVLLEVMCEGKVYWRSDEMLGQFECFTSVKRNPLET